jgi:hypothetical protein
MLGLGQKPFLTFREKTFAKDVIVFAKFCQYFRKSFCEKFPESFVISSILLREDEKRKRKLSSQP